MKIKGRVMGNRTKLMLKIAASVLFGVVLLEVSLRLVGLGPEKTIGPRQEVVDVDDLSMEELVRLAYLSGWINEPNTSQLIDLHGEDESFWLKRNWLGIREDDQTPIESPKGKRRIVFLGDSHTDGIVPNSSSYPNILERELGEEFDVLNCAQGASSPYDQLWAYQKVYQRLEPEIVIVGFYAGNDYIDLMNQHRRSFLKWDGNSFVRSIKTSRPDRSVEHSDSTILETLGRRTAIFHSLQKANLIAGPEPHVRVSRSKNYFARLNEARDQDPASTWQGLNQAFYFQHCPGEWDLAHRKFDYVLQQFKTIAPPDGLYFVIIPTYRQIEPSSVQKGAEILGLDEQDLLVDERVCDDACSLLHEAKIPYIDLREVMKGSKQKLYWTFDHHVNKAGHRLIAQEIYEKWSKRFSENTSQP